jgi:Spy/CpxP family protein refolding chaperone
MKLNKPFIVAALALGSLLAGSLALQAQETTTNMPPAGAPPAGKRSPAMSFENIVKQLEITDDQKIKAKAIFEEMQKQLADFRKNNPDASMADRRTKMKEIRDDAPPN